MERLLAASGQAEVGRRAPTARVSCLRTCTSATTGSRWFLERGFRRACAMARWLSGEAGGALGSARKRVQQRERRWLSSSPSSMADGRRGRKRGKEHSRGSARASEGAGRAGCPQEGRGQGAERHGRGVGCHGAGHGWPAPMCMHSTTKTEQGTARSEEPGPLPVEKIFTSP